MESPQPPQSPPPSSWQRGRATTTRWWGNLQQRTRMLILIVGGSGIVFSCIICCALGVAATQAPNPALADATATTTSAQADITVVPQATDTPKPTQTAAQQYDHLIQNALANDNTQSVKTSLDTSSETLTVTVTIPEPLTTDLGHEQVKEVAFDAEKAIWTSNAPALAEVDVVVMGPTTDQYGNNSISRVGEADLSILTAAKFNWSNIDADQAWGDYDNVYLL